MEEAPFGDELLGASLARRFGFRNVLTGSVLIGGAANFIFSICYRFHPICAAIVKAIQGFTMGPIWPVLTLMAAAWIPRNERSKFASIFQEDSVISLLVWCKHIYSCVGRELFKMQARVAFGILSFTLFIVTYVSRVNINMAVITMKDSTIGNGWDGKLMTLSANFWLSWISELFGSSLARRFGFRNVLGVCMLIGGATNFIFPVCYRYHPLSAVIVKVVQGIALGPTWPVISLMSASWIPKNERSKFASTFHGAGVGAFVAYVLGGILIEYLGWPSIFHASGILSMLWLICWWRYAADTPEEHPTISEKEKNYLRDEIGTHKLEKSNYKIPWKPMLMSKAFWGNIFGQVATMWMLVQYGLQLPTFMNSVYGVSAKTTGLLVGLPNISCFLFSLAFSTFIDRMIKMEVMSTTTARKMATSVSHLLTAVLTLLLAHFGLDNIYIGVALCTIMVTIYGAATTGTIANIIDISPNNSGMITSIGRMFSILPGFIIPVMIKHFTAKDCHNWVPIMYITFGILTTSGLVFLCLASGEVQHWNKQNEHTEENIDLMLKKDFALDKETNNI